jgi:hypothetical protein
MEWRIQPLRVRSQLLHTYTGETNDELHFSTQNLAKTDLTKANKKLLGEKKEKIALVGLAPFYAGNPAPAVSRLLSLSY